MKYLLWVVVGYLLWRWFKAAQKNKAEAQTSSEPADLAPRSDAETMVKCSQCGVYVPMSEALPGSDSKFFCSESHRGSRNA
ncbi:MAG: PP0621 family protein [bacterium]